MHCKYVCAFLFMSTCFMSVCICVFVIYVLVCVQGAHEFLSECLLGLKDIGHTLQMGDVSYQCPVDTLLSFQLQHIRSCRRSVRLI